MKIGQNIRGNAHSQTGRWSWITAPYLRCMNIVSLVAIAILVVGCMPSTPSGFPQIRLPQTSSGMPTPSSSSPQQQPGGSGPPKPGSTSSPSVPSPTSGLPSPGSSSPQLPRPPSLPSPGTQSPVQFPQLPSLPSPPSGSPKSGQDGQGQDGSPTNPSSGMPQMPTGPGGEGSSGGEEGTLGGLDIPATGPLQTGDRPAGEGTEDSAQADGNEAGGTGEFPDVLQGIEGTVTNGGWEVSNELPEPGSGSVMQQPDEEGDGSGSEFPQDGSGGVGEDEDGELNRTLGGLDGEIMAERSEEMDKANDRVAASGGMPGMDGEEGSGISDTKEESEENAEGEDRQAPEGPSGQANLPPSARAMDEMPDARDDDIIARQLREAANAETDPELKEKLWEEYRKYVEGRK